jgi:hypothetical protein
VIRSGSRLILLVVTCCLIGPSFACPAQQQGKPLCFYFPAPRCGHSRLPLLLAPALGPSPQRHLLPLLAAPPPGIGGGSGVGGSGKKGRRWWGGGFGRRMLVASAGQQRRRLRACRRGCTGSRQVTNEITFQLVKLMIK